jgi:hypothetical protein
LLRCGRVFSVEVRYPLWCMYFGSIFSTVVLWAISFPFDFELEPPAEHLAV